MRPHLPTLAAALATTLALACSPSQPTATLGTQPGGQGAAGAPTLPPLPAIVTLTGTVSAPSRIVAAGGGNIVAAGSGNIIAAAGGSLVAAGGGNVIVNNGGNIVGNAGGNIVGNAGGNIVGNAGGNLVAAGGGNMVAAGGGNMVAAGGGNMVAAGGGNMVAAGGGNLVQFGARMVAAGGGNMVAAGGGNMVAAGGGNMVAAGGGNMVAAGGGNIVGNAGGRYVVPEGPRRRLNAIEMSKIAQTPVVGARVLLTDTAGHDVPIPPTYTDADGKYTIAGVPGNGERYIVTVVVGDEAAALSARTYGLMQTAGTAPTGKGKAFKDLANPMVIGIALPGEADEPAGDAGGPQDPPAADGPPPDAEDRDDLFLKTFAAADTELVRADVTLATTVILEALVLANGQRRDDVAPEQWAEAVEKLTPLIREINPATLPKALLEAPIVDAVAEPAKAREVLVGWTVLQPSLGQALATLEQVLFATPAPGETDAPQPTDGPPGVPTPGPAGPTQAPAPTDEPDEPSSSGSDGAEEEEETEPYGTVDVRPGGYLPPSDAPTIEVNRPAGGP